ncbi:MAG: hypothetical protein AAF823_16305, partial [Planctomycetota bacterium]
MRHNDPGGEPTILRAPAITPTHPQPHRPLRRAWRAALILLALSLALATLSSAAEPPATPRPGTTPPDRYLADLRAAVADLAQQSDAITAAAEALAQHLASDPSPRGPSFAVVNNPALAHELGNRAGSIYAYDARTTPRPQDATLTTTPTTLTLTLPNGQTHTITTLPTPAPQSPNHEITQSPNHLAAPLHAAAAHALLVESFA